jgi:DNA-binding PadR family transcriptional regulator
MPLQDQIRKGSTEILILSLLAEEPMYGYQISQELRQRSGGYFEMKEGLLYPTLHRMTQAGWLAGEWRPAVACRRKLRHTEAGSRILREQTAEWQTFAQNLFHLLGATAK